MNEREIAERVAAGCVTVAPTARPSDGCGMWCVMIGSAAGPSVYGWQSYARDDAREQVERVRDVLTGVIAGAIAEDRHERCANAMRENAELRRLLHRARGVVQVDRALLINSESIGGDTETMDGSSRAELAELDELLRAIGEAIGEEKAGPRACAPGSEKTGDPVLAPGARTDA